MRNDWGGGMSEPTEDSGPNVHRIAEHPRAASLGHARMLAWLKSVASQRRLRWRFFEPSLAIDPAWDVMIELAIACLEGRTTSAAQLAEGIPGANQRWINLLVDLGYCEISNDPASAAAIGFTARGWDGMNRYVAAAAGAPETVAD